MDNTTEPPMVLKREINGWRIWKRHDGDYCLDTPDQRRVDVRHSDDLLSFSGVVAAFLEMLAAS